MGKKIFRSRPVQFVLALFLAGYIRLVNRTTRWQVQGQEIIDPVWAGGSGVIGALWHSRVLLSLAGWPVKQPPAKQPLSFLISLSPDGAFISKATQMWGVKVIRGSSVNRKKPSKAKGSTSAFRKMTAHIKANGCVAITPDGPRGPRMRASMGAVQLAAKTGAPILCYGCSTTHGKSINSWDRLFLPWPFGRGVIVWEGPIWVTKDANRAELEAKRLQLENRLISATQRADIACGHLPIEPAKVGS